MILPVKLSKIRPFVEYTKSLMREMTEKDEAKAPKDPGSHVVGEFRGIPVMASNPGRGEDPRYAPGAWSVELSDDCGSRWIEISIGYGACSDDFRVHAMLLRASDDLFKQRLHETCVLASKLSKDYEKTHDGGNKYCYDFSRGKLVAWNDDEYAEIPINEDEE